MEETSRKRSTAKRWLILLVKIAVTVICLWYVSTKIDFQATVRALERSNWVFLILALLLFVLSKIISAIRLNIYFKNIGIQLSFLQNLKLYWLGMFYNLFLPGSIGGDAYKVILLTKKFNLSYKKTTSAVLLDRISGVLALILLLAFFAVIGPYLGIQVVLVIAIALLSFFIYYWALHYWFKDFVKSFVPTVMLGLVVQLAQVVSVILIMYSFGIAPDNRYIIIFLISSIVAVLPLTIGGLGARELVFLEGSRYFFLAPEVTVLISILFYLITLTTSALGAIYVFKDPLKNKDPKSSP